MKKYLLLLLCCFVSLSAEKLFFGIGGIYGTGFTFKGAGTLKVNGKENGSISSHFAGIDGIFGQERYFSDIVGYRYYANFGYGIPLNDLKKQFSKAHLGANLDLIVSLPVSENFAFRFYGGIGTELGFLMGNAIDQAQKAKQELKDKVEKEKPSQWAIGGGNLSFHLTANAGVQVLFAESHLIEGGVRIPFLTNTNILHYKLPNESGTYSIVTPFIISARYIFLF